LPTYSFPFRSTRTALIKLSRLSESASQDSATRFFSLRSIQNVFTLSTNELIMCTFIHINPQIYRTKMNELIDWRKPRTLEKNVCGSICQLKVHHVNGYVTDMMHPEDQSFSESGEFATQMHNSWAKHNLTFKFHVLATAFPPSSLPSALSFVAL